MFYFSDDKITLHTCNNNIGGWYLPVMNCKNHGIIFEPATIFHRTIHFHVRTIHTMGVRHNKEHLFMAILTSQEKVLIGKSLLKSRYLKGWLM